MGLATQIGGDAAAPTGSTRAVPIDAWQTDSSMVDATQHSPTTTGPDSPAFRFYDNREKYLLFVTTTNEKEAIARRVGAELERLVPRPPAIRVFDAGMGEATVLSIVLEEMHERFPTVPFVVVGKEISLEDTRIGLSKLHTRFAEHPQTVVVVTNMYYSEAPQLVPATERGRATLQWSEVRLEGDTAHGFGRQLRSLSDRIARGWRTTVSEKTGNPIYVQPSVLVIYRDDQAFSLDHVIPKEGVPIPGYDLIIAAQPYRSRTDAAFKVATVLLPLARSLDVAGRMVVVQATGHDPGMEIIRSVWPGEEPFATPRHMLIRALDSALDEEPGDFVFERTSDEEALFTYAMHALPEHAHASTIGTSLLLAAWNAAVYVAQIDGDRMNQALRGTDYLRATERVIHRHGSLWFQDESFVLTRRS